MQEKRDSAKRSAGAASRADRTYIRRRSSRGGAGSKSEGREGKGQDSSVAAEHSYLFVQGGLFGG